MGKTRTTTAEIVVETQSKFKIGDKVNTNREHSSILGKTKSGVITEITTYERIIDEDRSHTDSSNKRRYTVLTLKTSFGTIEYTGEDWIGS